MNKSEFLEALASGLRGLPREDIDERLDFYSEMIDDRVEEGISEEDAVAAIGSVDGVVSQIVEETPFSKIVKEKSRSKRKLSTWEIVFISVGSPIWLALLITAVAVIIFLYAVLWSLVAVAWSVFGAFAGCSVGGITLGILYIVWGRITDGIALIGVGLVLAGLAIFAFYGCIKATKGTVWLTKKTFLLIKKSFIGKERS